MDDGIKNVTAYGDSIVTGSVAVMDDSTWLETATISAIRTIVGS